jgi:hypothetical protein
MLQLYWTVPCMVFCVKESSEPQSIDYGSIVLECFDIQTHFASSGGALPSWNSLSTAFAFSFVE